MITIQAFYMGRDKGFANELTLEIARNAVETVARANRLLSLGGFLAHDQVASGWRPKGVNERTANAGKNSRHLYGQAVDIVDTSRELARWCWDHQDALAECGLWMEHPDYTWSPNGNHWVHVQTVPPGSGRRIFIPNNNGPLAPEEEQVDQ